MIDENYASLISEKLKKLEQKKRKLQITQEAKELKQVEEEMQILYTMKNFPLSFASSRSSDEEIEYIINLYKSDIETNLEQINEGLDKLLDEWTNVDFLNEVAAYTIINIVDSEDYDKLVEYLGLLDGSHNNADNLYDKGSISKILKKKFPEISDLSLNYLRNLPHFFEIKHDKDFRDYKSRFGDKVVKYYEQYVANNKQLSLPFSEDVLPMLSRHVVPLLETKKVLEEKLKDYEDIDLSDKEKRRKFADEIIENIYHTHTISLPFYASYNLDELDKLFSMGEKISEVEDKKILFSEIRKYKEAYDKKLEDKSLCSEKEEYQAKYQAKYDRFKEIKQMLRMGDYSEGDTVDYFSVFLHHNLNQLGIPFCSSCQNIEDLTRRQFENNDELIEEVKEKLEKSVEKSDIRSKIEKYGKLKKSLIPNKKRIESLEKEIKEEKSSIIMSVRNSYAEEGYQLFKELPFLELEDGTVYKHPEKVTIEEIVEEDNNMLFDANCVCVNVKDKMDHILDGNNHTLEDAVKKDEENMQNSYGRISQMVKGDITEEEVLRLGNLTEEELEQVTSKDGLFVMQEVREIMVKYNELDDKTIGRDDFKKEESKKGK